MSASSSLPHSASSRHRASAHHSSGVRAAGASADGAPYRVPLFFGRDGETPPTATPADSATDGNLAAARTVRLMPRHRGGSMADGETEVVGIDARHGSR